MPIIFDLFLFIRMFVEILNRNVMFDLLNKYSNKGSFEFKSTDSLSNICNAPTHKSGVYIVVAYRGDNKELIYIGRSGKKVDGVIVHRKAGLGGIKDRIVNGHQFGKVARKNSWPIEMKLNKVDYLLVYWYDTEEDNPVDIEHYLLREFENETGHLPTWNKMR